MDYSDPQIQIELEDLFLKLESSKYIWGDEVTRFWLRDYLPYYQARVNATLDFARLSSTNRSTTTPSTTTSGLHEDYIDEPEDVLPLPAANNSFYDILVNDFLKMPEYKPYEFDIVFAQNNSQQIVLSRG